MYSSMSSVQGTISVSRFLLSGWGLPFFRMGSPVFSSTNGRSTVSFEYLKYSLSSTLLSAFNVPSSLW